MSRTSPLHAAAAALGVLAGFALAPGGAPPLERDVTPYAVAVVWDAPAPPVQVVRIRHAEPVPGMPAVLWSTEPAADPARHPHPHPAADGADAGRSAEAPGTTKMEDGVDAVVPASSRACAERSRRASARLRQS